VAARRRESRRLIFGLGLRLILRVASSGWGIGIVAPMEMINHIGKYVLEGFAFLFIGGVTIAMGLIFFVVIRASFFAAKGSEDSDNKRGASMVFVILRGLKMIWWGTLISGLVLAAVAVISKMIRHS